jgi:hypothetical protein
VVGVEFYASHKDRGGATMFNHNTSSCDCRHVVLRRHRFLLAPSVGAKWTANSGPGSAEHLALDDDVHVEGNTGISVGGNKSWALRFRDLRVTNKVFLHVDRGRATLCGLGWYVGATDSGGCQLVALEVPVAAP